VVISTINGPAQLALIEAASLSNVNRFIPSEFGGLPNLRPATSPFDQGRHAALLRLAELSPLGLTSTVFSCGIFYERFAPGGLQQSQLGLSGHIAGEGDYLMNFRHCRAEIPFETIAGPSSYVCMTSAQDLARAVVVALDLSSWPKVFRLRGDRLTAEDIVGIAEQVRGEYLDYPSLTPAFPSSKTVSIIKLTVCRRAFPTLDPHARHPTRRADLRAGGSADGKGNPAAASGCDGGGAI
jgi:hypothetical protein